jgi:hypothetical protein
MEDHPLEPLPALDCICWTYPTNINGEIIWSEDIKCLKRKSKKFVLENYKEQIIPHKISDMAILSEEDADELREAVMNSVTDWLSMDLPSQLEKVVRTVCEEVLNPGFARSIRANYAREIGPKIRREVELQIRNSLEKNIVDLREEIIREESDNIRAQIRSELTPIIRQELIDDMKRKLFE